jgi:alkyl hydroperoxide reductase subunit AhpC
VAELEGLTRAKARLDAAGVRVLLVNLLDEPGRVARFVQERRLDAFPLIRDGSGSIVGDFELEDPMTKKLTLPRSIVTDASGVVRAILRGGDGDHVERVLGALR